MGSRTGHRRARRRRSLAAGLLGVLTATAGCGFPADPDGTLERVRGGTLRAGLSPAPPWTEAPSGGHDGPSGTEVELVEGFAASVGAEVRWTVGGEEHLFGELDEGRLDLVVGGLTARSPWSTHAALTRPWTTVTGPDGSAQEHVLATAMGENAFLVAVERYAIEHTP